MPRRLFDAEYLFGLHEPGGEQLMLNAGRPGWLLFTEAIGRNPNDFSGKDFTPWANRNLGVICRINHGYYPEGTIPNSAFYDDFARRCANYAANSQGCKIWIIGNEMNFAIERPPAQTRSAAPAARSAENITPPAPSLLEQVSRPFTALLRGLSGGMGDAALFPPTPPATTPEAAQSIGAPSFRSLPDRFSALHPASARSAAPAARSADASELITPELYARCFRLCRSAIRGVPGHGDDQVLVGPVAPWNNQTTYTGNTNGDWVRYFQDILNLLGPTGCDGIALHTYTHGADPNLVSDEARMNPPFQNRRYHFRAYRDFMEAIPASMRKLPVYITETDQDDPWLDANNGWVQRAYGEVNAWNGGANNQQIRALILYRWPNIDRWVIETKPGVIEDFKQALNNNYRWREEQPTLGEFPTGTQVETLNVVNLRRTAGYLGKPASDVLAQIPANVQLLVLSGAPQRVDSLTWWNVRYARSGQPAVDGWVAQTSPTGAALLRAVAPPPPAKFAVGDSVRTTTVVNVRRTPGALNKPATDIIAGLPASRLLTINAGPLSLEGLTWWRVTGLLDSGQPFEGWVAEATATGQVLLERSGPVMDPLPPAGQFSIGAQIITLTIVRMRKSPGFSNKPADDVVADVPQGARGTVTGGPRSADGLTWWQVSTTNSAGGPVGGWMAEVAPNGAPLLAKAPAGPSPQPPPSGSFAVGELVVTNDQVRVRRTPGVTNKPADDTLGFFEVRTTVNILEGPRTVDGLTWWRVGGILASGSEMIGWAAERAPSGVILISKPAKLPGTNLPDRAAGLYLGAPYQGFFGVAQLWGENPQIYGQITYDGVVLKGHNGIDFLTPSGVTVLAVADGVVSQAVVNDPTGFGNFIKLNHPWGESLYAHLESFSVQLGQNVSRGQPIGRSGNTGFSNGPHLHFAIRINPYNRQDGWGGFSDPLPYLNPRDFQLPVYVLDAARGATARAAQSTPNDARWRSLNDAPGYAPDQPGVRRP